MLHAQLWSCAVNTAEAMPRAIMSLTAQVEMLSGAEHDPAAAVMYSCRFVTDARCVYDQGTVSQLCFVSAV